MKKKINEIKRLQHLAGIINENKNFNNMPKEELLNLFIETISNYYRGEGWKGVKYSKSLPTVKELKETILNRMQ